MSDELVTLRGAIHDLQMQLEALGVPLDRLHEIMEAAEHYRCAIEDMEKQRPKQFFDDAYVLQTKHSKKTENISSYLRQFAEHIVRCVMPESPDEDIILCVDKIPQMDEGYLDAQRPVIIKC